MGYPTPNLREITFRHDGEDHLVKLAMPTDDEVVLEHKRPGCEPHHRVDGKFRIHGNARNYYETKRERLLSDGWSILSFAGEVQV
jgi:hypothetical protein